MKKYLVKILCGEKTADYKIVANSYDIADGRYIFLVNTGKLSREYMAMLPIQNTVIYSISNTTEKAGFYNAGTGESTTFNHAIVE